MTAATKVPPRAATRTNRLRRMAGWSAYLSAVFSAVGIVLLLLFFTLGGVFGPLNDISIVFQYLLALPVALALHRVYGRRAPGLSRLALALGMSGMLALVALQLLLVLRVLTFAQQIGPVVVAFQVIGAWLMISGQLVRSTRTIPNIMLLSFLAWWYFGYPVWAVRVGRMLLSDFTADRG
jgi:hypothetical protein